MRIQTSKKLPVLKELIKVLKSEFSSSYSYKLFGYGQKSILVGKSALTGVQISVYEKEVSIISSPPSILGSLIPLVGATELAIFLIPSFFRKDSAALSQNTPLEREVGAFLKRKYS